MTGRIPRVEIDYAAIRVFYGDVLHVRVERQRLLAVQSWLVNGRDFYIEYVLEGGSMQCEYDDRSHWTHILSELDKGLT